MPGRRLRGPYVGVEHILDGSRLNIGKIGSLVQHGAGRLVHRARGACLVEVFESRGFPARPPRERGNVTAADLRYYHT